MNIAEITWSLKIFIILLLASSTYALKQRNTTRTDLLQCKLTHLGTEYRGSITTTSSGVRCQLWRSDHSIHQVSPDIKDEDFPERSMSLVQNHCRNPTNDIRGPWCYTMEPSIIDDECGIQLCNFGECRISGPGSEYGGSRKISSSRKQCESWDKRHKLSDSKTEKFSNKRFPDPSRDKADKFCRNPDGDAGGPWCYVEQDNLEFVEKEYCDVPFCDDQECLVYTKNVSAYSILTGLNSTYGNITLWIKLWDPRDEKYAQARILLTVLPVPTFSETIAEDWKAGVEILISNSVSGQTHPRGENDEEQDFENTPGVLVGTTWNKFWLSWGGGFISLGLGDEIKPLVTEIYGQSNTISGLYPDNFLYYGLKGTGILWSTLFCQGYCEAHTTFGMDFSMIWPVEKRNDTYDINFHVRASHYIAIRLYRSPTTPFPCITIVIGDANVISLVYQENEKSMEQFLKQVPSKGFLDFWTWNEFSISIFGSQLRLFSQRLYGNDEVLYESNKLFSQLRWFSIGSKETVAHWTLFCPPDDIDQVEDPWPPNCRSDPSEYVYEGSQWTSKNEVPCVPWIAKEIPEDEKSDRNFNGGSGLEARNKCRNPTRDPVGPYCYVISNQNSKNMSKEYCSIRPCRSSECRMAGTANDYVGILSRTRSNRTCAPWMSDYDYELSKSKKPKPKKNKSKSKWIKNLVSNSVQLNSTPTDKKLSVIKPIHQVNPNYLNDSLYPDQSVRNASNFCRDPSRNIVGAWCYTTDPLVPWDLCNIRDCEKPGT